MTVHCWRSGVDRGVSKRVGVFKGLDGRIRRSCASIEEGQMAQMHDTF